MASIIGVNEIQHTNGTTAITINTDGGIRLPETEGTWTPVLSSVTATDTTLSVVDSYTHQYGFYSRIGNLVYVSCDIQMGASISYTNGGADGQDATILGLPFPTKNSTGYYGNINVGFFANWVSWTAGYTPMGFASPGTDYVRLTYAVANGTTSLLTTYIANNISRIIFDMTYITDAA